jgi:hypothetical protein
MRPARRAAVLRVPTSLTLACIATACASVAGPTHGAACAVDETALLGGWRHARGGGSFEVFALEREGETRRFSAWLHERPESSGLWSFDRAACRLRVTTAGNMGWDYHVALDGDVLTLQEAQDVPASYRRAPD